MIYKLLFKPGAKYKSETTLTIYHRPRLSGQLLRCNRRILDEAQGLLYYRAFCINCGLARFIGDGGRRNLCNQFFRSIEVDKYYMNKTRVRELSRLTNLETLTVAFDGMSRLEPLRDRHGSYLPWGDTFIATHMHPLLRDMPRNRPEVVYYFRCCIDFRTPGVLRCRGWRIRVTYDADQDAVKAHEYEDWEGNLDPQFFLRPIACF